MYGFRRSHNSAGTAIPIALLGEVVRLAASGGYSRYGKADVEVGE